MPGLLQAFHTSEAPALWRVGDEEVIPVLKVEAEEGLPALFIGDQECDVFEILDKISLLDDYAVFRFDDGILTRLSQESVEQENFAGNAVLGDTYLIGTEDPLFTDFMVAVCQGSDAWKVTGEACTPDDAFVFLESKHTEFPDLYVEHFTF